MSLISRNTYVTIQDLRDDLYDALSTKFLMFDIEFSGKKFSFKSPLNKEEEEQMHQDKCELIKMLLADALGVTLRDLFEDVVKSTAFDRIDQLLDFVPSEQQIQSPIDPALIQEIKDDAASGKQIGLNYDAYQVKMQDPKLEITDDN